MFTDAVGCVFCFDRRQLDPRRTSRYRNENKTNNCPTSNHNTKKFRATSLPHYFLMSAYTPVKYLETKAEIMLISYDIQVNHQFMGFLLSH